MTKLQPLAERISNELLAVTRFCEQHDRVRAEPGQYVDAEAAAQDYVTFARHHLDALQEEVNRLREALA